MALYFTFKPTWGQESAAGEPPHLDTCRARTCGRESWAMTAPNFLWKRTAHGWFLSGLSLWCLKYKWPSFNSNKAFYW